MSILSIDRLSKSYGAIHALQNVSFEVPKGSVFGILGPNGSGKTTLLGIVMDVLHATSGDFKWNGSKASSAVRKNIGTLLETPNFYAYLSGKANLEIAAAIKKKGKEDISSALETVNLLQRQNSKFNSYSLGMKQRLAIASSLLGNPNILVFDEPTNGLDPAGIAEIRDLIKQLNQQGKTIIMASHILDEVEKVCTHVAIIQKGVLKTIGTVEDVLSGTQNENAVFMDVSAENPESLKVILEKMEGVSRIIINGNVLQLTGTNALTAAMVNKYCFDHGITLSMLATRKKNLETRFLEITGNSSDR